MKSEIFTYSYFSFRMSVFFTPYCLFVLLLVCVVEEVLGKIQRKKEGQREEKNNKRR